MKARLLKIAPFALVALSLGVPAAARAAERHFNASACSVVAGTATFSAQGQVINASGQSVTLWCPVVAEYPLNANASLREVTVDGWWNANQVFTIRACSAPVVGGNMSCSNSFTIPGGSPRVFNIAIPLPTVDGYPFMEVILPPILNGGTAGVFGYKLKF